MDTFFRLLPIVLMGCLVLALGGRIVIQGIRENHARRVTLEDYLAARDALNLIFAEADVMRRILSAEDTRFISERATSETQKLFQRERKQLAIRWIRRTQRQMSELMKLHLMLASYTSKPNDALDFGLSMKYVVFKFVSTFVLGLVWLAGPLRASAVVGRILGSAGYFWNIFHVRQFDVQVSRLASRRNA